MCSEPGRFFFFCVSSSRQLTHTQIHIRPSNILLLTRTTAMLLSLPLLSVGKGRVFHMKSSITSALCREIHLLHRSKRAKHVLACMHPKKNHARRTGLATPSCFLDKSRLQVHMLRSAIHSFHLIGRLVSIRLYLLCFTLGTAPSTSPDTPAIAY